MTVAATAGLVHVRTAEGDDGQPRPLAGLGRQLRFVARRDRLRAVVWITSIVGLVGFSTVSVLGVYTTAQDRLLYAEVAQADAAFKALNGPGYGLTQPTDGAIVMNETSLYTYIAVALMAFFMVVRHTRAEEDSGRAELVRAAPVGRYTMLTAACLWVVALAAAIAVGLVAVLLAKDLPANGSLAFAAATFAIAVVFAAVAAVTAQLASTGRAANSLAGIVLGASFLLRAVGDMGTTWMVWLSPLGVTQAIRPFADERWWVLLPLALVAAGCFAVAGRLLARRDLGSGFIGQQPGPATGGPRLATPGHLAIRLQRASIIGWVVGVGISSFAFGLVIDQAEALADNEAIAEVFAQSGQGTITEQFLAAMVLMLAILTSGFSVASVLRLRSEELAGRADPILATPVSRVRWWSSHTIVAFTASAGILAVAGLGVGAGYAAQVGDAAEILPVLGAAAAMFAALSALIAFTAFLVGVLPRWAPAAWGVVALAAVVGFLAETLDLPQWIRNLSPFEHVPPMPAAAFAGVPIVALVAVSAVLLAAGAMGVARRDVH